MSLTWVATYRRSVAASLERAWENVLDWEHLPVLHASTFGSIDCEDAGDWGWRASVGLPGPGASAPRMGIALTREDPGDRYVVRTTEGPGTGTEIWTRLHEIGDHETGVEVRFGVPDVAPEQAAALGQGYVGLYTRLWDEDEGMMVERERALARLRGPRSSDRADVMDLGPLHDLRGKGPLDVEAGGRVVRVEEENGAWLAYPATCPHRLGPLERHGDELRCPWHGYRFSLSEGKSCDGRGLALPRAPRVEVSDGGRLLLRWDPPR